MASSSLFCQFLSLRWAIPKSKLLLSFLNDTSFLGMTVSLLPSFLSEIDRRKLLPIVYQGMRIFLLP